MLFALTHIVLLLLSLALLIVGADFIIRGASALALRFHIPEMTIGLGVVALGTSLPELFVNLFASYQNRNMIVFSNVIGSNIFNLYMILGGVALIYPINIPKRTAWGEIPFLILATVTFFLVANDMTVWEDAENNIVTRTDGAILLGVFLLFVIYLFTQAKETGEVPGHVHVHSLTNWKLWGFLIGGSLACALGGQFVVNEAVELALHFNVSEKVISLSVIAFFTSLPEIATTSVAIVRQKDKLAMGNIIGSCIYNLLFVVAISSFVQPLDYPKTLNFDLNFFFFGTILLFLNMFTGSSRQVDRWEAFILLMFFIFYVYFIFIRL